MLYEGLRQFLAHNPSDVRHFVKYHSWAGIWENPNIQQNMILYNIFLLIQCNAVFYEKFESLNSHEERLCIAVTVNLFFRPPPRAIVMKNDCVLQSR